MGKIESPSAHAIKPASHILGGAAPNAWVLLAFLASLHFLVDIIAGATNPLWPIMERRHELPTGGLLWAYVCWIAATSIGQLGFGFLSDRRPCPWLVWIGPLLGIVCVSSIGLASNLWQLAFLLIVGGLGIAAFHPEAAAMAGSTQPAQRSRAMAIFALCGYLGQSVGPAYSGAIVASWSLTGLVWSLAWATPVLLVLWLLMRTRTAVHVAATASIEAKKPTKADVHVSPWLFVLLLSVGSLRILPALGVPLTIAYLLEGKAASSAIVGAVQSAFMAGIGIGAMGCAAFIRPQWERRALWAFPLAAAILLTSLSVVEGWTFVALVGCSGAMLGITMPVFISYGQQLPPHSQRVASSITMGVSWGLAGGMVAAAIWSFRQLDSLHLIFWFFAFASVSSSVLCFLLPKSRSA